MATHSSILAWEIPWTEEPGGYSPWGHKESDMTEHSTEAVCLYPTMDYIPQWKIVYPYERGNPATFDNIDGP